MTDTLAYVTTNIKCCESRYCRYFLGEFTVSLSAGMLRVAHGCVWQHETRKCFSIKHDSLLWSFASIGFEVNSSKILVLGSKTRKLIKSHEIEVKCLICIVCSMLANVRLG